MIIIRTNLIRRGYNGLAAWPFIFVRPNATANTILHEKIHLRQQVEMLVLPFFVWYAVEFLIRWVQSGFRSEVAYHNVSFEREAYLHENDTNHLPHRYFWEFLLFLRIPAHAVLMRLLDGQLCYVEFSQGFAPEENVYRYYNLHYPNDDGMRLSLSCRLYRQTEHRFEYDDTHFNSAQTKNLNWANIQKSLQSAKWYKVYSVEQ